MSLYSPSFFSLSFTHSLISLPLSLPSPLLFYPSLTPSLSFFSPFPSHSLCIYHVLSRPLSSSFSPAYVTLYHSWSIFPLSLSFIFFHSLVLFHSTIFYPPFSLLFCLFLLFSHFSVCTYPCLTLSLSSSSFIPLLLHLSLFYSLSLRVHLPHPSVPVSRCPPCRLIIFLSLFL